jgi:hypothetical protein
MSCGCDSDTTTPGPIGRYDGLRIPRGATWSRRFLWQTGEPPAPVDLTGYIARLEITLPAPAAPLLLTTENGRLLLNAEPGTIDATLAPDDTAALALGTCPYALTLTAGPEAVTRLLEGYLRIV